MYVCNNFLTWKKFIILLLLLLLGKERKGKVSFYARKYFYKKGKGSFCKELAAGFIL